MNFREESGTARIVCCRGPGLAALAGFVLAVLFGCGEQGAGDTGGLSPGLVALNNRGVAEMGRFDYEQAHRTFTEVVSQAPQWEIGQLNLAVATLNRRFPGDEGAAMALLSGVAEADPGALRAHYMMGILTFNRGDIDDALVHFSTVSQADPNDAYAVYYHAQCLLQLGRPEEALPLFRRALTTDPYLRSAAYGAFLTLQRMGRREQAREALSVYQRLDDNPRSRLAEIKYTRMGPRAAAVAIRPEPDAVQPVPAGALFGSAVDLGIGPALSASVRVEGDVAWLAAGTDAGLEMCDVGAADSRCRSLADLPFAGSSGVLGTAWGDYDNDGLTDLYLLRAGPNQLWRQLPGGQWSDVTGTVGVAGGDFSTVDALLVDADHDGDLDLLLANSDAPSQLLSNNGNGTFRDLSAQLEGIGPAVQVAAADLDADRDLDIVMLSRSATPVAQVWTNDRLWQYRRENDALGGEDLRGILSADLDVDGSMDLVTLAGNGDVSSWARQDKGWRQRLIGRSSAGADALMLADLNGNGRQEIVAGGSGGWRVFDGSDGRELASGSGMPKGLVNLDPAVGPALLVVLDGRLSLLPPGPGRHPFVGLEFSGLEDTGQSMRSNASGIGTEFVARSGDVWTAGSSLPAGSLGGQSLQPVFLGTGGQGRIATLEIDWSDGVYQSELDLSEGTVHRITETQRQLASCPVLFASDGSGYRFVSDVLGVGGIGFNAGFGQYGEPRPRESFLLPPGLPAVSESGYLEVVISEPMEELAYIDRVRLVAHDFPQDLEMTLDERMGLAGPVPTGEPVWFSAAIEPVSVTDQAGQLVSRQVRAVDLDAAPLPPVMPTLLGLLQEEHQLVMEFDRDLSSLDQPVLLMDGWVEYGYSQTSFAAWQMGLGYSAATLEVWNRDRWEPVYQSFGYPAGMPRLASLPLPQLPAGSVRLRLRSRQQIYWDRLALAESEQAVANTAIEVRLADARVEKIGFPRRSTGAQMVPDYDYAVREPFWDTRYQSGHYTSLGPAEELIQDKDNALAIIGPGDALIARFTPPSQPPKPGFSRRWVLMLDGWAKDMDLFTRDGETVGPLPRQAVAIDRSGELHARYNNRFRSGR